MDFKPSWQLAAYYPAPVYAPPPVFIDVYGMPVFMGPFGLVDMYGAPYAVYAGPYDTDYEIFDAGDDAFNLQVVGKIKVV